jgi:hypothetical protein
MNYMVYPDFGVMMYSVQFYVVSISSFEHIDY